MTTPMPVASVVPQRQIGERRAWPRSERRIRVLLLAEDSALAEPFGGWIVNTSRGGLRLRVPREGFPIGSLLLIRSPFASTRVPWTALRVKNIREVEGSWEMGCEFAPAADSETTEIISLPATTRIDRRHN
ncbi:MAG: PilZ domain-containing protein [Planctomycetia bacterium]|nr:PilZ domain-containing protein [Planctomycetia bacterium]